MKNPFESLIQSQVANFQEGLMRALDELRIQEFEGSSGGGVVTVAITGLGDITSIKIDPAVVNADEVELLNDLVCAAVRDAVHKAADAKKRKVSEATPLGALGVELPDVF